ncbi:hypothetical protein [Streptomyces sp. AS58]|uniref:hypothetical protein n=1 Tax=Streptomyces sp. AS58 TaxID=1519489 RepID=UPI000B0BAAD4|nr:hypothetical protein [Streptomyces sp. AS58]
MIPTEVSHLMMLAEAFREFQYPSTPLHVQQTRVEDAWVSGQQRAAKRLEGLMG